MQNSLMKAAVAAVLFGGLATQAFASGWDVWTEKQGADRLTIVASYSGDGTIEEAQLDLNIKGAFEVIDTQTLYKGSICFANSEKNVLRAVPPSGAGKALKKSASDTCMFSVRIKDQKGWQPSEMVGVTFKECASSVKGIMACDATVRVVK